MSRRQIARDISIDLQDYSITIDGAEFPFWVREVPEVTAASEDYPINIVTLEILVDNVRIIGDKSVHFFDQHGERTAWAKACVNRIIEERLGDTLAWLRGAGVDV